MTDDVRSQAILEPARPGEPIGNSGSRMPNAFFAWAPLIVLPAAVLLLVPATWPRWACMWAIAIALYSGCKWLTWRTASVHGAPAWKHAGYLLAWPGLDADAFLSPPGAVATKRPDLGEWLFALGKLALGAVILFAVTRLVPARYPYLVGWAAMIGIVMILHFGLFHLLSCGWRSVGVEAKPLMNWPLAATNVSEFWGKRWNTAFRDLTHRFLFRPLAARLGARGAILAGFAFSGLVHELVVSVPAGGGYGGPTLFFAIQGAAIFSERSKPGRKAGLGKGWTGWLFTAFVLLAPAYGLFHPPFVESVVVPFVRALGAI